MSSLFQAVKTGDIWRSNFLITRGIRINTLDNNGENILVTALHIENQKLRYKMMKWLIRHGADIMAVGKTSARDILLWASYLNRDREMKLVLTDAGGELDMARKDFMGYSALHYCTFNNAPDMLRELCMHMRRYGISVDIPDVDGMSPYLLARRLGHEECAQVLHEVGMACPHMGDNTGQSQHFWDIIGDWERAREREEEKAREVGMYKRMGRLPQLIKAKFDTNRMQMIPSNSEHKVFAMPLKRHNTLKPLDLSGFDPEDDVIKSRVNAGAEKSHNKTKILTNIYKCMETDNFFVHEKNNMRCKSHNEFNYTPRVVRSILDIASEQGTHSFVPPARPPRRNTHCAFGTAANVTAFSIKIKRRLNRSRMSRNSSGSGRELPPIAK